MTELAMMVTGRPRWIGAATGNAAGRAEDAQLRNLFPGAGLGLHAKLSTWQAHVETIAAHNC